MHSWRKRASNRNCNKRVAAVGGRAQQIMESCIVLDEMSKLDRHQFNFMNEQERVKTDASRKVRRVGKMKHIKDTKGRSDITRY